MPDLRVEGGAQAYCAECKEHGHYVTMHYAAPPRPDPRIYWGPY